MKKCPACGGYGLVSYDQHDDGEDIIEDCRECGGTGNTHG